MKIFLIGYMGSGKTTIGRKVAKETGIRFMDMDAEIEAGCGKSISDIFASEGESYFRDRERDVIGQLSGSPKDMIVATGGGVPCFGDNMERMGRIGKTVYLKMSPQKLAERLERGRGKRPIIRDMDDERLLEFIRENLAKRAPYYERASFIIDCDGASDTYIARHIGEYIDRLKTNQDS